jgi:hypothetical protein
MSWYKLLILTSLILLVAFLAPCPAGEQRPGKSAVVPVRRLPDLTVTHFALAGPASKTYPFMDGVKPYPGYVFVPVTFTVANNGTGVAGPFEIAARCRLSRTTVRPADFLSLEVSQDVVGGFTTAFAPPPSFKVWVRSRHGVPLSVSNPLPAGGKVTVSGTLAVPVGGAREGVKLSILADCNQKVVESNKKNNESQAITLAVP